MVAFPSSVYQGDHAIRSAPPGAVNPPELRVGTSAPSMRSARGITETSPSPGLGIRYTDIDVDQA